MLAKKLTDGELANKYADWAGRISDELGDPYAAISMAREAVTLDYRAPNIMLLGELFYKTGDMKSAEECFLAALEQINGQGPEFRESSLCKDMEAYCLAYLGQTDKALEICGQAVAMNPDNPALIGRYGWIKQMAEAKQRPYILKAPETYMDKGQLQGLAKALRVIADEIVDHWDDFDATLSLRQRIVALDPEQAENHHELALVYEDMDFHGKAHECFAKAAELDSANLIYAYDFADSCIKMEQYEKAAGILKENLAKMQQVLLTGSVSTDQIDDTETFRIMMRTKKVQRALDELDGLTMHRNALGVALNMAGRPEEARIYLEQAVSKDPDNVVYLSNLADVFNELGRKEEAEQHLLRALEIDPDNHICLRNLKVVRGEELPPSERGSRKIPKEFLPPGP